MGILIQLWFNLVCPQWKKLWTWVGRRLIILVALSSRYVSSYSYFCCLSGFTPSDFPFSSCQWYIIFFCGFFLNALSIITQFKYFPIFVYLYVAAAFVFSLFHVLSANQIDDKLSCTVDASNSFLDADLSDQTLQFKTPH